MVFLNYKEKKKEEKKFPEAGRRWREGSRGREGRAKAKRGELNQYTMKYPSVGVCENNDKEIRREKPGKQM